MRDVAAGTAGEAKASVEHYVEEYWERFGPVYPPRRSFSSPGSVSFSTFGEPACCYHAAYMLPIVLSTSLVAA
jgi:hypothetical protein